MYKLRIKLGASEFEAEGPEETVKAQFEAFLAAASHLEQTTTTARAMDLGPAQGPKADATVDRAFSQDREGYVSLRVLPATQDRVADALLLLLYGFRTLKQSDEVPATTLMEAARQSGLQIQRIDRSIAPHEELITKGGTRRGGRYGLNNRGIARAESLLAGLFG
jgi:hypothetical protein